MDRQEQNSQQLGLLWKLGRLRPSSL